MVKQHPSNAVDFDLLTRRLRRIFSLDTTVFAEVRDDRSATVSAIIVAVASIFIFSIGGLLWWVINGPDSDLAPSTTDVLFKSVVVGTVLASLVWVAWVAITYVMLNQLFHARVDVNQLFRVMGFATAPLALGLLMFLPAVDFAIGLSALILLFGTMLIAVQTATDALPGRVLVATGAGFFVWAVILCLFVTRSNFYAPGFFIFEWGSETLRSIS